MKPVVLAVLLLLCVASIVFGDTPVAPIATGDTPVASIVPGDTPVAPVVSGDTTQSGKSRYGGETCLPVYLQTLHLYKFVPMLN
jgi:hypothetical protein